MVRPLGDEAARRNHETTPRHSRRARHSGFSHRAPHHLSEENNGCSQSIAILLNNANCEVFGKRYIKKARLRELTIKNFPWTCHSKIIVKLSLIQRRSNAWCKIGLRMGSLRSTHEKGQWVSLCFGQSSRPSFRGFRPFPPKKGGLNSEVLAENQSSSHFFRCCFFIATDSNYT